MGIICQQCQLYYVPKWGEIARVLEGKVHPIEVQILFEKATHYHFDLNKNR
jgi:hypothetical protein